MENMSGTLSLGSAQIGPIDIGPEVFAADTLLGFSLDVDAQRLAKALAL